MAALDLIGPSFSTLENLKREELAKARADIDRRMESRRQEFLKLVARAASEGAKKVDIAAAADVSRQTVYNWLAEAGELSGEVIHVDVPDGSTPGAAGGTINPSETQGLWLVTDPGNTFTAKVKVNGYPEYDFTVNDEGLEVPVVPTDEWLDWNAENRKAIIDVIGGSNAAAA